MAVDSKLRTVTSSSVKLLTQPQITQPSGIKHWKCKFPQCSFSTKYKTYLGRHFLLHDTDSEVRRPFACRFDNCGYRSAEKGTLNRHTQAKHTPEILKKFQCSLCSSKFASESLLLAHIPQHLKEKSYKCVSCDFSTHSKESLRTHVRRVHETSLTFKCSNPGCQYSTTYRNNLNRHRQIHDPDPLRKRPHPCSFANCSFRASNPGHLKSHVETQHNPDRKKEHICPLCSKTFYTRQVVRSHIRSVHTKEKTLSCDKCKFKTHLSASLRRHRVRAHEEAKPREKKFKCEACSYRTDGRVHMDLHRKSVHSSDRKLQCDVSGCQYRTNYSVALRDHRLIHETEPERRFPVACTFPGCDFRRRLKQKLKKHTQNHISCKKQLKCTLCPNKYPDLISLNFHRDMVHGKICYRCPNCNYNARFKRNFEYHMRNQCWLRDPGPQQPAAVARSGTKSPVGEIRDEKIISICKFAPSLIHSDEQHRVPLVILQKIHIKIV